MKKNTLLIVFIFTLSIATTSMFIFPHHFKTDGGSCYQGISARINNFLLIVCCLFITISFIVTWLKYSKSIAIISSIISLLIWSLWSLIHMRVSIIDFLYLVPYLTLNIIFIITTKKTWKTINKFNIP